jgi:hypothetical protein
MWGFELDPCTRLVSFATGGAYECWLSYYKHARLETKTVPSGIRNAIQPRSKGTATKWVVLLPSDCSTYRDALSRYLSRDLKVVSQSIAGSIVDSIVCK